MKMKQSAFIVILIFSCINILALACPKSNHRRTFTVNTNGVGLSYEIVSYRHKQVAVVPHIVDNRVDYSHITSDSIIIPPTINYRNNIYTVVEIADLAFYYFDSLKYIKMPNTIISVGDYAFIHCTTLENIEFSSELKFIGEDVFYLCGNLREVNLPNSLKKIGDWAFYGCKKLESIDLPNSLDTIGKWGFADCYMLDSINLPYDLKWIGDHAFFMCKSLKKVRIPSSMTIMSNFMFHGCASLLSVYVSKQVKEIDVYAFSKCDNVELIMESSVPPSINENSLRDFNLYSYDDERVIIVPNDSVHLNSIIRRIVYIPDNSISNYSNHKYWGEMCIKLVSEL